MANILPVTPSLLSTFKTCPRQYEAKYITKEVVFQQNEAAAYGDRIHKAVENALKHGAALTPEASYMQPLVDWCLKFASQPGVTMLVEDKLAITRDWTPCTWWGNKNKGIVPWLRGIADVRFNDSINKRNIIVDWKTGKVRDDPTQASILSLCGTKTTGYVDNICVWSYVRQGENIIKHVALPDVNPVSDLLADVRRYEAACSDDHFPAKPNGLCKKWCDVLSCPHNGKRGQ